MPKVTVADGAKTSSISNFTPDVIGVCKLKFVYCPKCSNARVASSWEQSIHFSWGLSLSCNKCNMVWMICKDCSNVNSYFCSSSQMFQHHRKKHVGIPHLNLKQLMPCKKISSCGVGNGNTPVVEDLKVADVGVSHGKQPGKVIISCGIDNGNMPVEEEVTPCKTINSCGVGDGNTPVVEDLKG